MNNIKKGNLNYDQSGRAYPDNHEVNENWNCIWENNGKYYKLVGDDYHKEWEEVDIFNQIIDEAYKNYEKKTSQLESFVVKSIAGNRDEVNELLKNNSTILTQEEFINKCKTDLEFSEKWGLKIEERELTTVQERKKYDNYFDDLIGEYPEHHATLDKRGVPRKLITITYNNETIEIYDN